MEKVKEGGQDRNFQAGLFDNPHSISLIWRTYFLFKDIAWTTQEVAC